MNKKLYIEIGTLKGIIMSEVKQIENRISLTSNDGRRFLMEHEQDCCEVVHIESISGDLSDLVDSPILFAEESKSHGKSGQFPSRFPEDRSVTWTFYKLATIKGWVDIRWYGTSNGYYSEEIDIVELIKD